MKKAHITARPDHKVGDEVISLCGKEFTVKVLWADIAFDKPICRKCVDIALEALTDAEGIIETARIDAMLALHRLNKLDESLSTEEATKLDEIAEADIKHRNKVEAKQREAAELEQAQKTCTCTWTSPEIRETDPDCPIHGSEVITEIPEITNSDE
jgi:hypothetical protein